MCLKDAGFCEKGEIGPFFDEVDTTSKGTFPINTDGGQLSGGQPVGGAGGFRHVIEGVRQIRDESTSQVPGAEVCLVTSTPYSPGSALILRAA